MPRRRHDTGSSSDDSSDSGSDSDSRDAIRKSGSKKSPVKERSKSRDGPDKASAKSDKAEKRGRSKSSDRKDEKSRKTSSDRRRESSRDRSRRRSSSRDRRRRRSDSRDRRRKDDSRERRRRDDSRDRRRRSDSRDRRRRRSDSRERRRSRDRSRRRSLSRDRRRGSSRSRRRSNSRRRSRSRDRRSRDRKRSNSRRRDSRDRKRESSRDRRRSHSRDRKRESSRDRKRDSSKDRKRDSSKEKKRDSSKDKKDDKKKTETSDNKGKDRSGNKRDDDMDKIKDVVSKKNDDKDALSTKVDKKETKLSKKEIEKGNEKKISPAKSKARWRSTSSSSSGSDHEEKKDKPEKNDSSSSESNSDSDEEIVKGSKKIVKDKKSPIVQTKKSLTSESRVRKGDEDSNSESDVNESLTSSEKSKKKKDSKSSSVKVKKSKKSKDLHEDERKVEVVSDKEKEDLSPEIDRSLKDKDGSDDDYVENPAEREEGELSEESEVQDKPLIAISEDISDISSEEEPEPNESAKPQIKNGPEGKKDVPKQSKNGRTVIAQSSPPPPPPLVQDASDVSEESEDDEPTKKMGSSVSIVHSKPRQVQDRYDDHHRSPEKRRRDRDSSERQRRDERNGRRERSIDKSMKSEEPKKPAENKEKKPAAPLVGGMDLTTRTGGAYIPPAKLRMMQEKIKDKSSVAYQRMSWEALKKSINGLINKVNVSNIIQITKELFQENIVRGRGLLARSVISAQAASPTFTHVYAALVAIINTKFPQNGELILRRLILQFRRGFRRNDKALCLSSTRFIAHLVNQVVAHEVVALEVLTLLLERPTEDSVEVAVGFLKECGQKLTEISPRGVNSIFERLRNVLHEGQLDLRVQYMVEVMFAIRKDGFKDHQSVLEDLDLVQEEEQFTHLLQLEDATNPDNMLNIFKEDPLFVESEEKYKSLKKEILDEDSTDDESGDESSGSGSEEDSDEEEEEKKESQRILDQTETNLVALRRTIYLTVQSSLDHNEAAHKMLKMDLKPGQEVELVNMILDCCAQLRTYEKFFGLLAQKFCQIDRKYIEPLQQTFIDQYETVHRLETNKLRNVAKFFAHLLHTDAISWGVLSVVKLTEEDTTSASRIFLKILFQELSEYMGLLKLNDRLKDQTLSAFFQGIMPRDNPKNTRFAINFFTTIGLGGLTDDLREHLKQQAKQLMQQKQAEEQAQLAAMRAQASSDSDSDSSSESESEPEPPPKKKKRSDKKKKKSSSKKKKEEKSKSKKKSKKKKESRTKDNFSQGAPAPAPPAPSGIAARLLQMASYSQDMMQAVPAPPSPQGGPVLRHSPDPPPRGRGKDKKRGGKEKKRGKRQRSPTPPPQSPSPDRRRSPSPVRRRRSPSPARRRRSPSPVRRRDPSPRQSRENGRGGKRGRVAASSSSDSDSDSYPVSAKRSKQNGTRSPRGHAKPTGRSAVKRARSSDSDSGSDSGSSSSDSDDSVLASQGKRKTPKAFKSNKAQSPSSDSSPPSPPRRKRSPSPRRRSPSPRRRSPSPQRRRRSPSPRRDRRRNSRSRSRGRR